MEDDLIQAYEEMWEFFSQTCASHPPNFERLQEKQSQSLSLDMLMRQDLVDLTCLIAEVAVGSSVPGVVPQLKAVKRSTRLRIARELFSTHKSVIPSGFRRAVELLLFDESWGDLPLKLIRRCVFNVPAYIVDLYRVHSGLLAHGKSSLEQVCA